MVKHIIIWQMKEELSEEERAAVKAEIKEKLEALVGVIDGLKELKVITEVMGSSNGDLMLDCTLEDEKALDAYAVAPAHTAVKDGIIMPNVKSRVCIDYKI
jgi:hypothetical protein